MSYTSLLIDSCTVSRYTEGTRDSYGKPARTWADHLTAQACRLTTPTGREVQVGVEVVIADYLLFMQDVDVTEEERIISGGVTYEILLVKIRQDGVDDHHRELFLRTIK